VLFDGYGRSVIKVPYPTVGATTSRHVGVGLWISVLRRKERVTTLRQV